MVVPAAFLLDEDLATKLTRDGADFSALSTNLLAGLELLVLHDILPHACFAAFFALRRQLYQ